MMAKGEKKPDEYADALVSHPQPELLQIHDPEKFGCSPCHGKRTRDYQRGKSARQL